MSENDSHVYQLLVTILNGEDRGLEVTLHAKFERSMVDSLDGTISPLLRVSGTVHWFANPPHTLLLVKLMCRVVPYVQSTLGMIVRPLGRSVDPWAQLAEPKTNIPHCFQKTYINLIAPQTV
jgi:hypothetical protein